MNTVVKLNTEAMIFWIRILFTLIAAILLPLGLFAQEAVEKAEKGIDEIINEKCYPK